MLSLKEIIAATGGVPGDIENPGLRPSGVSTDSRTIAQGELFVALQGPNFDGHRFLAQAFEKGAVAAIVSNKDVDLPRVINVADTLKALGEIARFHREKLDIPVIMITGTNGKTTTKNILRDLLSLKYNTYANPGNFNNLIGLPSSMMEITAEHEVAVLEAGISEKGELTRLAEIAKPTHGLLTNIGPGHLENLGTVEGVLDAKWKLVEALKKSGGKVYLNADFSMLMERARAEGVDAKTFALLKDADFKPESFAYGMDGTEFKLKGQEFHLSLLGGGNLSNAVAALAMAAEEFDIPLSQSVEVIERVKPERFRLQRREVNNLHLLIDCYNANPVSMKEALELLTLFPAPRIAVLGAMLELGSQAQRYHHEILEMARDTMDLLIITGPYSELYPRHEGVLFIPDKHKAAEELHKRLLPGASVLIKGSHSCALEDIVSELWGGA